jgi:hypothetical protein
MARRGGRPHPPICVYLPVPARCRPAGVSAPAEGPNTHARREYPMSAPIPYERFRPVARRAPGPGPASVPGIAPFAGAHTARRHPGRNGHPMTGRTPYDAFRTVHPGGPQTARRDSPRETLSHSAPAKPCSPSAGSPAAPPPPDPCLRRARPRRPPAHGISQNRPKLTKNGHMAYADHPKIGHLAEGTAPPSR